MESDVAPSRGRCCWPFSCLWGPRSSTDPAMQRGVPASMGPITQIPLIGWTQTYGSKCSLDSIMPIAVTVLFMVDVVLAIFAGLDAVHRGLDEPWVQFVLSVFAAFAYTILFLIALANHRNERLARFRYHWVLALFLVAIITWSNFGIYASWIVRYGSQANGVSTGSGNAYLTWLVINGVTVALFFVRFLSLVLAQGLSYTFERAMELHRASAGAGARGKSLTSQLTAMALKPPPASRAMAGGVWRSKKRTIPRELRDKPGRSPLVAGEINGGPGGGYYHYGEFRPHANGGPYSRSHSDGRSYAVRQRELGV